MPSRVIAFLLVLLLADVAWAGLSAPTQPDPHVLRGQRRAAGIERGAGLALAGLGIGTCAAGIALLGTSGKALYAQGSVLEVTGAILAIGSLVLIVPGAWLAIDGQSRLTKADWRLRLITGAYVLPTRGGAMGGFGFAF